MLGGVCAGIAGERWRWRECGGRREASLDLPIVAGSIGCKGGIPERLDREGQSTEAKFHKFDEGKRQEWG